MKKFLCLFALAALLYSCGGTPSGVLPKEKMEAVLWDVIQGGEFVNGFVATKYSMHNKAAMSNKLLGTILSMHQVSKKEFDKSIAYYQSQPAKLKVLLDSISAKKSRIETPLPTTTKSAADSIAKKTADSLKVKTIPAVDSVKSAATDVVKKDTTAIKKNKLRKKRRSRRHKN